MTSRAPLDNRPSPVPIPVVLVDPTPPLPVALVEPWWARAITRWGIGTVLAVYLVYVLVTQVTTQLTTMNANLVLHMQSNDTMKELLSQVCSNTAKTDDERTFCFDITTHGNLLAAQAAAAAAAAKANGGGS